MKYFVSIIMMSIVLFAGCEADKKPNAFVSEVELSDEELIERGKRIAMNTFNVLSTELQNAMEEGGVSNAIQYCNLKALPLTDSLSILNNAIIKRTSDKLRNPQNSATDSELSILNEYKKKLKNKELLKPIIQILDGDQVFYAPIILSEMCANCHGQMDKMKDYNTIAQLYPNDQATGYVAGDLRGMWSITLKK